MTIIVQLSPCISKNNEINFLILFFFFQSQKRNSRQNHYVSIGN
jgi:hypothetical protein